MSHPISTNKHVAAKQLSQDNTVSPDVVRLENEFNEIGKSLTANPSRVDAAALNARRTSINNALKAATIDGQQ